MKTKTLIILISAVLMASCSGQDEGLQTVTSAVPIGFNVTMGESSLVPLSLSIPSRSSAGTHCQLSIVNWPSYDDDSAMTRADAEIGLTDLKAASSTGFGVFAAYTGQNRYADSNVSPDFMYNQQVKWDNAASAWSYSPVKYWPGGDGIGGENFHYVSFFAYAPYSDLDGSDPSANPAGYCVSGFSQAHGQGDPWITYRLHEDVSKQVDLLYAKELDQIRPAVDKPVSMEFGHALACVGDDVTVEVGNGMKAAVDNMVKGTVSSAELVLTDISITYTLAEKGRLILWNDGAANWQPVFSENLTTQRSQDLLENGNYTLYSTSSGSVNTWTYSGDDGIFFIPIEVDSISQKAEVVLKYKVIVNGSVTFATHEASTVINLGSYAEAGKKVLLKVVLDNIAQ